MSEPNGFLTTRTLAMPSDTNPAGDLFGGWVVSQMDIAAGIRAGQRAQSRVVTVTIDAMSFILPVKVGDVLGVYTRVIEIGSTSMVIAVEAWARRDRIGKHAKVTEGKFKFVSLDDAGKAQAIMPLNELPDYAREGCEA